MYAADADLDEGAMNYAQAVAFTGVNRRDLERAVERGEIETFVVGKRHRVLVRASVRAWLKGWRDRTGK